ncbi:MAG: multidrug efflux RND transporter permease subunit [Planctomycetota bacterium]|nr:MAG: multidrug efflux RND transporter permease subunit [Planctomycetota bacterium]REJ97081.1 MAG: multidrug efflux RND transporter permease subunit [Planctomycetota bacterium]REK20568.1 MAG: multidrug efflux RND transporter permease subunit [Planctomycetota bacterium]REK35107.1 MAG: multidrug efflux RND transporter permease subunit [Planctomycetota bacterium]
MSRFFIHRPIFASVISIVIVIAGVVTFQTLPVAKFPQVSPPTVEVKAIYPGADAETIAETVAAPIEQEVNGVEGMIYMSSTSAGDGTYTLTVTFELGTDMDMASVLVQNRVAIAEPKLPEDVRRQGITTKKKSTQILQFVALYSPDDRYDALYLSNYGLDIKDELSRLAGVGEVTVFGRGDYSMRVWLDPQKLKQRGLTTEDVVNAVREQNVQVAAGQIGAAPAPDGTAFQLTVNTQGRLKNVEDFEQIIITTGEGGRVLRVADVARVELGAKNYTFDSNFNGKPSASLAIYQLPEANAVETSGLVSSKIDELQAAADWPAGLEVQIPFDTTRFVEASIDEVYNTLLIAAALVVLVIFIFLQDWRATIVPVAAIPVSLIGTFAVMAGLGFSINMLSLFGIVLAIGIVVDDAIVVVENTTRHLQAGLSPRDAAVKAMSEITGPVIATTLVLLAVFVPTAFMGGITGQLNRQFALTIAAAVIISTINALTLSPALCGLVLRPPKQSQFVLFRWFNSAFDGITGAYTFVIKHLVRVVALVMLVYVGLVGLTGWSLGQLPTGFVPTEDQGYMFVDIQLPDAASMQRTEGVMEALNDVYAETPGVTDWVSIAGYSLLGGNAGSNLGFSVLIFKPWEERNEPGLSQAAIQKHLQQEFAGIQQARVFGFIPPPIDGLGNAGGFQMEVRDNGSAGYARLQAVAEDMAAAGNGQTGLQALNTTFRANVPQLFADVDRTKAKTMSVPLSSVFGTLQAYLGSAYVNDFTYENRSYQVRLQAEPEFRASPEDIESLDVRDAAGRMVPMASLVDVSERFGPTVVRRYNLSPSAAINGSPAPGFSSGQALALMEQMAAQRLPASFDFEWTGMSYQEIQAGKGQATVFILAVVFVFLVLAAQYESWTSPAAVIAVVPLAVLGVVIALLLRGADNNTYTQIGIVLLVGLASKNAILIVEFASEERSKGVSIRESAVNAANLRFRAILMTAFSSILGFLPLLVASGAGAASRQAVGNAVVGGMLAATVFSLTFVPTFFVVFRKLSELRSANAETTPPAIES